MPPLPCLKVPVHVGEKGDRVGCQFFMKCKVKVLDQNRKGVKLFAKFFYPTESDASLEPTGVCKAHPATRRVTGDYGVGSDLL